MYDSPGRRRPGRFSRSASAPSCNYGRRHTSFCPALYVGSHADFSCLEFKSGQARHRGTPGGIFGAPGGILGNSEISSGRKTDKGLLFYWPCGRRVSEINLTEICPAFRHAPRNADSPGKGHIPVRQAVAGPTARRLYRLTSRGRRPRRAPVCRRCTTAGRRGGFRGVAPGPTLTR